MSSPTAEDPRAEGRCGVTRSTGLIEWICINDPHDTEKQHSSQLSAFGYYPRSERHYFVRRYPMRGPGWPPDPWAGIPYPVRKPLDLPDEPPF